jgi:hypothetical protein
MSRMLTLKIKKRTSLQNMVGSAGSDVVAGSDEEDLDDRDDGVDLARKLWTKEVPACALSLLPRSSPSFAVLAAGTLCGPDLKLVASRAARRTASCRRTR